MPDPAVLRSALDALREWAITERADWSERNADRYWQMGRVVKKIDDLLTAAKPVLSTGGVDPTDPAGGPFSIEAIEARWSNVPTWHTGPSASKDIKWLIKELRSLLTALPFPQPAGGTCEAEPQDAQPRQAPAHAAPPAAPRQAPLTVEAFREEVRDKLFVVYDGIWSSPLQRNLARNQCEEFLVDLYKRALATANMAALHEIGVRAMAAQSDPNRSATTYRAALVDICNYALKAQDEAQR